MKKNLATAMAAAMAFGAVVPAFANQVETFALIEAGQTANIDVRVADGYKVDTTVYTRYQVYNRGMDVDSIADDTLRPEFKNCKIIYVQKGAKLEDDQLVVAKKADATDKAIEKTRLDAAKREIEEAKKVSGTTISTVETPAKIDELTDTYTDGYVTVTVTNGSEVRTYKFHGTSTINEDENSLTSLKAIFSNLKLTDLTVDLNDSDDNYEANLLKYTIEKHAHKFDIVTEESTDGEDMEVSLYKKGTKQLVETVTFENFRKVDVDSIVNIPAKGDFTKHWAEDEIVTAMLKGHVDTSKSFRPQDSVTRAEFVKMACTIFNIDVDAYKNKEESFHDVSKNDWFYKYVVALYNVQETDTASSNTTVGTVINGYGDTFKPNDKITRQEAAKIVASLYDLRKGELSVGLQTNETLPSGMTINRDQDGKVESTITYKDTTIHRNIKTSFKDDKNIADWADESAEALKVKGILTGNPDKTFTPENNITRAEALVTLNRAITK